MWMLLLFLHVNQNYDDDDDDDDELRIKYRLANSVDPDEVSYLGLRFLQRYLFFLHC